MKRTAKKIAEIQFNIDRQLGWYKDAIAESAEAEKAFVAAVNNPESVTPVQRNSLRQKFAGAVHRESLSRSAYHRIYMGLHNEWPAEVTNS